MLGQMSLGPAASRHNGYDGLTKEATRPSRKMIWSQHLASLTSRISVVRYLSQYDDRWTQRDFSVDLLKLLSQLFFFMFSHLAIERHS